MVEFNRVIAEVQYECNEDTCPRMSATDEWHFLCAAHRKPMDVIQLSLIIKGPLPKRAMLDIMMVMIFLLSAVLSIIWCILWTALPILYSVRRISRRERKSHRVV